MLNFSFPIWLLFPVHVENHTLLKSRFIFLLCHYIVWKVNLGKKQIMLHRSVFSFFLFFYILSSSHTRQKSHRLKNAAPSLRPVHLDPSSLCFGSKSQPMWVAGCVGLIWLIIVRTPLKDRSLRGHWKKKEKKKNRRSFGASNWSLANFCVATLDCLPGWGTRWWWRIYFGDFW